MSHQVRSVASSSRPSRAGVHRPRCSNRLPAGLAAAFLLCASQQVAIAMEEIPGRIVHLGIDSGDIDNPSDRFVIAWRKTLDLGPEVTWSMLDLAGTTLDKGSAVRITFLEDGQVQALDREGLELWSHASGGFNGALYEVELIAAPQSSGNRLLLEQAIANALPGEAVHGKAKSLGPVEVPGPEDRDEPPEPMGQCGSGDDRAPSTNPRVGRLRMTRPDGSGGSCTGWITNQPPGDMLTERASKMHLTAGHCFIDDATGAIENFTTVRIEFNVPSSDANCTTRSPPLADQYPVQLPIRPRDAVWTSRPNGCLEDWAIFHAGPSQGLYDWQRQGRVSFRVFAGPAPPPVGTVVSVTGYGRDNGMTGAGSDSCAPCVAASGTGQRNSVQQTASGTVSSHGALDFRFDADSCPGNSGGPVHVGDQGYGILSGGNCTPSGGFNCGTRLDSPELADRLRPIVTVGSSSGPEIECAYPSRAAAPGTCAADIPCEAIAWCADADGDTRLLTCDPTGTYDGPSAVVDVTCTDSRGASATATCPVFITDPETPVVTCAPRIEVECTQALGTLATHPAIAAGLGAASASDNCEVRSFTDDRPGLFPSGCLPGRSTTVRFVAQDRDGNGAICDTEVVVIDRTPPGWLSPLPANVTATCQAVPLAASLLAQDACDPAAAVSFVETRADGSCPQSYVLTRTWTASDACGNARIHEQVVTVVDSEPPAWTAALPADRAVACDAVPTPEILTALDACDAAADVDFDEARTDGPCPHSYSLTRTWVASDACGNERIHEQHITVVDAIAPALVGVPPDVVVGCTAIPAPPTVGAVDNCDASPVVTFVERRIDGDCPGNHELRRTWTATDACGNARSQEQIVTVRDTTPPVVTESREVVHCAWPPNHGFRRCYSTSDFAPAIADDCSLPITWSFSDCVSDQAADGVGDGHTDPDCVISADGLQVCVRVERSGTIDAGRHYAVGIVALDACGNASSSTVVGLVRVPHDASGNDCARGRDGSPRRNPAAR